MRRIAVRSSIGVPHLLASSAIPFVFPAAPHAPVDPYRGSLYQPRELYARLAQSGHDIQ